MSDNAEVQYPDGSAPETDENGTPILMDRSAEFVTRTAGFDGSFRGLARKRAERAEQETPDEPETGTDSGAEDGTPDAPEESGTPDTPTEPENGEETGEQDQAEGKAEYDPAQHTVAEVQAYIAEHPDEADSILARERTGKARTTLIGA